MQPSADAIVRHPHLAEPCPDGWVRVDLHSHTMWSGDSTTTPEEVIEAVEASGIDVLAITDHNAIRGAAELADKLPCRVIIGEEIKTRTGEIIGLFLSERVPFGLPAEEVALRIRDQGGVVYIPHPFDELRTNLATASLDHLCDLGLIDAARRPQCEDLAGEPQPAGAGLCRRTGTVDRGGQRRPRAGRRRRRLCRDARLRRRRPGCVPDGIGARPHSGPSLRRPPPVAGPDRPVHLNSRLTSSERSCGVAGSWSNANRRISTYRAAAMPEGAVVDNVRGVGAEQKQERGEQLPLSPLSRDR